METFHSLRFEDGDLLVKLENDPNDWLLLNKKTVSAAVPQLAAMFRFARGPTQTEVVDPSTAATLSYYTLSLKLVDDTLVLSTEKDIALSSTDSCAEFHKSVLSEGWPIPKTSLNS